MVRTNIQLVWLMVPLLALQGGMLGVLGLLSSTSSARGGLPAGSILGMGAIAVVIVLVILYAHLAIPAMAARQRIVFGDGTYTFTGWFRTVRLRAEEISRAAAIGHVRLGAAQPTHHLVLAGPRRRLLILVGQMWDIGQLGALANDMADRGVPLISLLRPFSPAQLRSFDPRLMPWRQARPFAFASLLATGLIVLAVGAAIAVVIVVTG
ncbi:hypothetical protein [Brevibacterium album]|uniref:hypothetical protein n=1 Tax=Brevibacterium album TaxID=417948 RepID=UPI00040E9C93|nr:hypothetical protein [Brevibacterium album]